MHEHRTDHRCAPARVPNHRPRHGPFHKCTTVNRCVPSVTGRERPFSTSIPSYLPSCVKPIAGRRTARRMLDFHQRNPPCGPPRTGRGTIGRHLPRSRSRAFARETVHNDSGVGSSGQRSTAGHDLETDRTGARTTRSSTGALWFAPPPASTEKFEARVDMVSTHKSNRRSPDRGTAGWSKRH